MNIPDDVLGTRPQKTASDQQVEEILNFHEESISSGELKSRIASTVDVSKEAMSLFYRSITFGDTFKKAALKVADSYGEPMANAMLLKVSNCTKGLGIIYAHADYFEDEFELRKFAKENPHVGLLVMSAAPKRSFWKRANPMKVIPSELYGMRVISNEDEICDCIGEDTIQNLKFQGMISKEAASAIVELGVKNASAIDMLESAVKGSYVDSGKTASAVESDFIPGVAENVMIDAMGPEDKSDFSMLEIGMDPKFLEV